jgi:hypothetical protein
MKRTTFLAFFLSHGGGRETFGLCIVAQRNLEPGWVMPAGYIEPRKIVFHRRRVPHQTCGMKLAARIARIFANFAAKPIAQFGKFEKLPATTTMKSTEVSTYAIR